MEKISENDLMEDLNNLDQTVILNNAGEAQWIQVDGPINLEESLEQDIDFNKIPDNVETDYVERQPNPVLDNRSELTLGLTPEDLKDLFTYVAGQGQKPEYVDRFMADMNDRIRELTAISTLIELSKIPILTAYSNQVNDALFNSNTLYGLDAKDLSTVMTNIGKEKQRIMDSAVKTIITNNQFGALNSDYRKLLDGMMMLPSDKLKKIQDLVFENEKKID